MEKSTTLDEYLERWRGRDPLRRQVAELVAAVADGGMDVADGLSGRADGAPPDVTAPASLETWALGCLLAQLSRTPVQAVTAKGQPEATPRSTDAAVAVSLVALDRAANLAVNGPAGTLFGVLPSTHGEPGEPFLQPGRNQLAAGCILYGPSCALALTLGDGTDLFTLAGGRFRHTASGMAMPRVSGEYAINASNCRAWSESIRAYIDDRVGGSDEASDEDVTMRWTGSLAAECHRILARGGAYLSPREGRRGRERGRLQLVHEANPVAFLVEQAGGKAFDGFTRILDLTPEALHERTPLMFGSANEIDRIARYKANPNDLFERSPLFGQRGLLKV